MWQFGGILVPLLAGPCRVAALTIWTTTTNGYSFDTVKAMMYMKYQITTFDKFFGYFVNYLVYGMLYPAIGFSTTFKQITFTPADVVCYNWNNGAPTRSTGTVLAYNCSLTPLNLWT